MRKGIRIALISLASVLGLVIIVLLLVCWLLFSSKGLDKAADYAIRKFCPCQVETGRMKLTFFKTFPQLGLEIKDLVVYNDSSFTAAPADTLASIGSLVATIDTKALRKENEIIVEKIRLADIYASLYTDAQGNSNLDVFAGDSVQEEESEPFTLEKLNNMDLGLKLDLQKICIEGLDISYFDAQSGIDASLSGFDLLIKGKVGDNMTTDADVKLAIKEVSAVLNDSSDIDAQVKDIQLDSKLCLNKPDAIGKGSFSIARVVYDTDSLDASTEDLKLDFDLAMNIETKAAGGNIRLGDKSILLTAGELDAMANNLAINIDAAGSLDLKSAIDAAFNVAAGELWLKMLGSTSLVAKLGSLGIDGKVDVSGLDGGVSMAKLGTELSLKSTDLDFNMSGQSPLWVESPLLEIGIDGFKNDSIINCNTALSLENTKVGLNGEKYLRGWPVSASLPLSADTALQHFTLSGGKLAINHQELNLGADCKLKTGGMDADASLSFDKFDIETILSMLPASVRTSIEGIAASGIISLDANAGVGIDNGNLDMRTARADITVDKLAANINDSIKADASTLDLSLNYPGYGTEKSYKVLSAGVSATDFNADIVSESPISAKAENLLVLANLGNMLDSTATERAIKASVDVGGLDFAMDTIRATMSSLGVGASYRLSSAWPEQEGVQLQLRFDDLDASVGNILSAHAGDSFIEGSAREDTTEQDFLLRWNPGLSMRLTDLEVGKLEVPISAPELAMDLNLEYCEITNSQMTIGNSDVELTGRIDGVGDYLRNKDRMEGELDFYSSYADIDQLLALTSGAGTENSSEEGVLNLDGVAFAAVENISASKPTGTLVAVADSAKQSDGVLAEASSGALTVADTIEAGPFIVPELIDVKLNTEIEELAFNGHLFHDLGGDITLKDGALIMQEVGFSSDAAEMQLTAIYKTPQPDNLYVGLDFHLLDIQIDELIDLIPSVDSIVPMLKSFDGTAQFHLAAETNLNSSYIPKMPTLIGAAAIEGKDLVVIDNEVFDGIKRKLLMSRGAKNVIDSLDIEMQVLRNKVDLYPCRITMDRYSAVLGGRHNINKDLDCRYHISLIECPLPIRLGVTVEGSLDDISASPVKHIKITRPEYDKMFRQEKHNVTDARTLAMKQQIAETLKENVR